MYQVGGVCIKLVVYVCLKELEMKIESHAGIACMYNWYVSSVMQGLHVCQNLLGPLVE
jgi:hypothetical protein